MPPRKRGVGRSAYLNLATGKYALHRRAMNDLLVITADLSTAGLIRRAARARGGPVPEVVGCRENFTFGPLLDGMPFEMLLRRRYRHWRRLPGGATEDKPPLRSAPLRARVRAASHVRLMVSDLAHEQLSLIVLGAALDPSDRDIEVHQFFPKSRLGDLHDVIDKGMAPDLVVPLEANLHARCRALWSAITAPRPEALFAAYYARTPDRTQLPLEKGLGPLILAYPDAKNGLSLSDRMLLSHLSCNWEDRKSVV